MERITVNVTRTFFLLAQSKHCTGLEQWVEPCSDMVHTNAPPVHTRCLLSLSSAWVGGTSNWISPDLNELLMFLWMKERFCQRTALLQSPLSNKQWRLTEWSLWAELRSEQAAQLSWLDSSQRVASKRLDGAIPLNTRHCRNVSAELTLQDKGSTHCSLHQHPTTDHHTAL